MTCSGLFAQDEASSVRYNSFAGPRNTVSISYGTLSLPQIGFGFGMIFGAGLAGAFTGGKAGIDNIGFQGCYAAEYYRLVGRRWELGAIASADPMTFDSYSTDSETNEKVITGTSTTTFVTFMPAARYRWVDRKHVAMYSKLAVGVMANFTNESKTDGTSSKGDVSFSPSFHATLVGCEAGGEHVRGFAELGFGMNGFLSLGLRTRF